MAINYRLLSLTKLNQLSSAFVCRLQTKKVELLEDEYERSQSDLRLAFKRIQDLQNMVEDGIATDTDDRCVCGVVGRGVWELS